MKEETNNIGKIGIWYLTAGFITGVAITLFLQFLGVQERNALPEIVSVAQAAEPNVWGKGETSEKWRTSFGDDNIARLNFVQTNLINNQGQLMAELALRIGKLEKFHDPCVANTISTTTGKPEYCVHNPDPNEVKNGKAPNKNKSP